MAFDPASATTSGCDSREYSNLDDDVWSFSLSTQVTIPGDELDFDYGIYYSDVTSTHTIPHDNVFDYSAASTEISPSNAIGLVDDLTFGAQTFYTDVGMSAQYPHQISGAVYEAQSQADDAALLQAFLERETYLAALGLETEAASILTNALSSSQLETIDPSLLQTPMEMAAAYSSSPSTSSGSLSTPTSFASDMPLMITAGCADLPLQLGFSTLPSPPPAKLLLSSSPSPPKKKARHPAPPPHVTPAIGNIKLDRASYEHYRAQKRGVTDASGKTFCPVPGCHGQWAKFCASQYQRHMRSHCLDFKLGCSYCGKDLSRRDALKRHKCAQMRLLLP
ncbi:hypothetical protein EXIGLDRAFT_318916 [Exidia glandulosa HHB12029]|uniref:C2H2-type domain-containing protein n=1 Tax=Exidia glandulosa HHB12029 TaxID=1314781 RepID=A0A165Q3L5_EXIGL|nr:hypothetical protein EXIGLDRAFT_318916 [Exidia glandulosa HHB12029]